MIIPGKFFLRLGRMAVLSVAYAVIVSMSLVLALLLRFDFSVPPEFWAAFGMTLLWLLPLKLLALAFFGQFRTLLTYFSLPDAKRIAGAIGAAAFVAIIVWFAVGGANVVPRGVIVSDMVISFMALTGFRTSLRLYRERVVAAQEGETVAKKRRAAIIGAGASGAALLRDVQGRRGLGLDVVCFVDDDRQKIGSNLHGRPVFGPTRRLGALIQELGLHKVIIAMPKAKPSVIKKLVEQVNAAGIVHDILPSVGQPRQLRSPDKSCPMRSASPAGSDRQQAEFYLCGKSGGLHREVLGELGRPAAIFFPSDGNDVSTPELIRRIARANVGVEGDRRWKMGDGLNPPLATRHSADARLFTFPEKILKAMGRLPGLGALRKLTSSLYVDSEPMKRDLGWTPPFTMDEGLRRTLAG